MFRRHGLRAVVVCCAILANFGTARVPAATLEFRAQYGGPVQAVDAVDTTVYAGIGHCAVVLDISDPAEPVVLGESAPLPDPIQALTVDGPYVYVAGQWAGGLVILDVSTPGAPVVVGALPWIGPAVDIAVVGSHALVAVGDQGLAVVDVSDPAAPFLVTTLDTPGDARGVAVAGTTAYVADGPGGLLVVDVADPTTPALVGTCGTIGDAEDVRVAGTTAYVAAGYDGGLVIVDVANTEAPAVVGSCSADAIATEVTLNGGFALVANAWAGLALVDVSTPSAPVYVGQYDTPGWAMGVALAGTLACVADQVGGVQLIDVSAAPDALLAGEYRRVSGFATDVAAADGVAFVSHGGQGGGVLAFDLSDPTDPQPLSSAPSYEFAWGLAHAGSHVYLADGCAGFGVIDATDPADLQRVGDAWTGCAARDVVVRDGLAYVADDQQGLHIIDVSAPNAPTLRATWQHPVEPGYALGVAVAGDHVFLTGAQVGLDIIDVSDPDNPVGVARYDTDGSALDVAVAGDYAYVADDWGGLVILDVSDPTNPTWVGTCGDCVPAQGVSLSGSFALVAAHSAGVHVVSVADPAAPTVVASYDTGGFARRVGRAGNLVLVADEAGGLVVLELGGAGEYVWANALGGDFTAPENWVPSGPPGPADRAIFDLPDSYAVAFPPLGDIVNDRLLVDGGDVTFDLGGGTYTLAQNAGISQTVAATQSATLWLGNGTLANRGQLVIAEQFGVDGRLVLDGYGDAPAVLTSDYQLMVGVDGGSGTIDVVGPQAALYANGRNPDEPYDLVSLELGRGGDGVLNIFDGGYVRVPYGNGVPQTGYMSVGGGFGSGTLTVYGGGSTLDIDCMLEVGRDGTGIVWVEDGGALNVIGTPPDGGYAFIGMRAPGEVYVGGPEARLTTTSQMTVGQAHSGSLWVGDGGTAEIGGTFIVGDLPDETAHGTVTVTGLDSTLYTSLTRIGASNVGEVTVSDYGYMESARQIQLGYSDAGYLEITAGGTVVSYQSTSPTQTSGLLGMEAGACGYTRVTGPDSRWTQDGALNVGWYGHGELIIDAGGFVSSVGGIVGRLDGSLGTVTVTGPDSAWHVAGPLTVGGLPAAAGGEAELAVEDGATVTVDDGLTVWSLGTVRLDGGAITLGAGGAAVSGQLTGRGAVVGDVSSTGGVTAPGLPLGRLDVDGDFAQDAGGTLVVELGGTIAGDEYDQLAVTGSATLAGTLHVALADGFVPMIGDRFDVVTAGAVGAAFGAPVLPSVPGRRFVVKVSATAVTVVVTWPADVDGDLDIDIDDFAALAGCLTGPDVPASAPCAAFDLDGDEDVDLADFGEFQCQFTGR